MNIKKGDLSGFPLLAIISSRRKLEEKRFLQVIYCKQESQMGKLHLTGLHRFGRRHRRRQQRSWRRYLMPRRSFRSRSSIASVVYFPSLISWFLQFNNPFMMMFCSSSVSLILYFFIILSTDPFLIFLHHIL